MSTRMAILGALTVMSLFVAGPVTASLSWAQERTVEDWIASLQDEEWKVRKQAVEVLGQMKDSYALEPLTEALQDQVPEVRARAAYALGAMGEEYSVEPLILALQDQDSSVRRASAAALTRITGQDLGEDPRRWQKWWEENQDLGGGY